MFSIFPAVDPFGGDPFKETDPFKASSEDFFKKTIKMDPFATPDPFSKSATLPSKVLACAYYWGTSILCIFVSCVSLYRIMIQ